MMRPVVTANVWNRCQNRCRYCVSCAPNRHRDQYYDGRDFGEVLDVHALIRWLDRYRPTSRVHVSGGEPLLFGGIEAWVGALLDAGRDVTILTNGQAFPMRPGLHAAPVGWIVTYHVSAGIPIVPWASGLTPLRGRARVSVRVLMRGRGDRERLPGILKALSGFSVSPRWVDDEKRSCRDFGGVPEVDAAPPRVASEYLTLIENDGRVYPCNTKLRGAVGSIYDMTFDAGAAAVLDDRAEQCYSRLGCGACNTEKLTQDWVS